MKKALLILFSFVFLFGAGAGAFVWYKLNEIETITFSIAQTSEFEVKKGDSLYKVVDKLREHNEINDLGFKIWLQLHPQYRAIQSGVYEIQPNSKFVDVLELLSKGLVKQLSVTLIEGQTIAQWLNVLSQTNGITHDIVSEDQVYEQLFMSNHEFCINQYQSVEGCLLPDTYFYTHGTKSSDILSRALNAMRVYIDNIWPSRFLDVPINTQYEALVLASIIEKETAIESERTEIAGVFVNRLNNRMRLQTDPTVIYGIGKEYDGNITRKHLRTPTPYNTYVIKGLPITPIAMPNKASIQAALLPAFTDSLYFVATGNGGHQFSTNLTDHNKAVRQYLKQRKINLSDDNKEDQ